MVEKAGQDHSIGLRYLVVIGLRADNSLKTMRNPKKIILWLLAQAMLICLGAIVIESQTNIIRRLYDDLVLDNTNHYLSCNELPTEKETISVLQGHQDVVHAIEAVNPGLVGIDIDSFTCPGKADLLIWYTSHQNRLEIENIIQNDTFFGIPYRLENR